MQRRLSRTDRPRRISLQFLFCAALIEVSTLAASATAQIGDIYIYAAKGQDHAHHQRDRYETLH